MGSKVEQVALRLSTCERSTAMVGELQRNHKELSEGNSSLHSQQRAVKEYMEELHRILNDHSEKHSSELELVKTAHTRLATEARSRESQGATTLERLAQVELTFEKALASHAGKQAEDAAGLQTKLDQLHMRLAEDRAGHESHLRSLMASERERRDAHHTTLR